MNLEHLSSSIFMRVIWAIGIISFGLALYWLANRVILARVRSNRLGLAFTQGDIPILLYFTTPSCLPCKTIQRPAIQSVKERLGESLQVIEIDAASQPDIASRWGVLSVPTTFLIDYTGQPRHINHGVTTADKLFQQVKDLYK